MEFAGINRFVAVAAVYPKLGILNTIFCPSIESTHVTSILEELYVNVIHENQ
jgi:hypothetical protein